MSCPRTTRQGIRVAATAASASKVLFIRPRPPIAERAMGRVRTSVSIPLSPRRSNQSLFLTTQENASERPVGTPLRSSHLRGKTFSHDRIPFVPPRFSRRFPTPLPTSSYVDAIVGVRNTAAEGGATNRDFATPFLASTCDEITLIFGNIYRHTLAICYNGPRRMRVES